MKQSERARRAAPFEVTSAIPGRIRLRFADPDAPIGEVAARVREMPGVEEVSAPPGTQSLVVRYRLRRELRREAREEAVQRELDELVADVEGVAASGVERAEAAAERRARRNTGSADAPLNGRAGTRRNGGSRAPARRGAGLYVLHQMRGRIRLGVPGLRLHTDIAARFEHDLSTENGIRDVEVQARDEFVIIRYDSAALSPDEVVTTVAHVYERDLTRKLSDDEFHRAADLKPREEPRINPLLAPTIAYGLAAMEAPPLIAGGALVLAALPIARRASQVFRRACEGTSQFDLISLGLFAARGNFVGAALLSWLVALNDLTRRNAREDARRTVSMWQAGQQETETGRRVAEALEQAPLSNAHLHTDSLKNAGCFDAPLVGVAVTDFLINRDVGRVVGILKPRCEFESGLQFVVPATVLTAMTSCAENGVLFTNAKAMERMAQADAVVLALDGGGDREALRAELRKRGIEMQVARDGRASEDLVHGLQIRGRVVALVADNSSIFTREPRADVTLYMPPGPATIPDGADVVAADLDFRRIVFAVDGARRAEHSTRNSVRMMTAAAVANVTTTLMGVSSAPLATLVNAGVTITASMNALRTKPVPESADGVPRLALETS